MHHVAATLLVLVALVHLAPLLGVLGADRLEALYGIAATGPDLSLLMRHRAVLFGLLAGYQLWAVARPMHRTAAFVAGIASLGSFLVLARMTPGYNEAIARVVAIDVVALAIAIVGLVAHAVAQRQYPAR